MKKYTFRGVCVYAHFCKLTCEYEVGRLVRGARLWVGSLAAEGKGVGEGRGENQFCSKGRRGDDRSWDDKKMKLLDSQKSANGRE